MCHRPRAVPYAGAVTDVRQRRHEETRRALVDAAIALFAERGFASVTMDEIARAAGVSRSTAYRRFATKEDVVLDVPRRWLRAFDAAVASLPPETDLREATRVASFAVADHIDTERSTVLAAFRVLDDAPALRSSTVASRAWLDRFAELVHRFAGDEVDPVTARIAAGAYMGALDAMMEAWAGGGGAGSVRASTGRLVDRLEPILPP